MMILQGRLYRFVIDIIRNSLQLYTIMVLYFKHHYQNHLQKIMRYEKSQIKP